MRKMKGRFGLQARQLSLVAMTVAIGFAGANVARADFDFVGGDPGANANGTNTDFFNAVDGWVNTGSGYALIPPTSGADPNTGSTLPTMNINTGVTDTGAIFDPASEDASNLSTNFGMTGTTFNTNGKVYIGSNNSGPGNSNYTTAFPNNPFQTTVPNYFDVKSGEFHVNGNGTSTSGLMIVGRSATGTLEVDGGNVTVDSSIQVAGDGSNFEQVGNVIYNGGVLQAGLISSPGSSPGIRLGNGSASTGNLIVYNNGTGNITLGGLYLAKTASGGTTPTVGNVEFHYDNGGTRPIQIHNDAGTAELSIRNSSAQLSTLNLVLDSSPTMTLVDGTEVPQNLGLFSADSISGNDPTTEFFYDPTGTTLLGEGSAITVRAPNGYTDTWDISYRGTINFSDPSNSVISSVTGPNNLLGDSTTTASGEPTAVVLMGVSAIAPVMGDVDGNGIVNAADFNIIHSNYGQNIPGGYAVGDLNDDGTVNGDDWAIFALGEAEYQQNAGTSVPEPATAALALLLAPMIVARRRRLARG